jgi:hypothetical protein
MLLFLKMYVLTVSSMYYITNDVLCYVLRCTVSKVCMVYHLELVLRRLRCFYHVVTRSAYHDKFLTLYYGCLYVTYV